MLTSRGNAGSGAAVRLGFRAQAVEQRIEHAITPANLRAGERVRWLPRRHASDLTLPGNDFWLIDDRIVRFNLFSGDGAAVEPDASEDPAVVKLCADAFTTVWERAVPHEEYSIR